MATCPHCQAAIEGDFGLVTCGSCGESVFLDMNGDANEPVSADLEKLSSSEGGYAPPPVDEVQNYESGRLDISDDVDFAAEEDYSEKGSSFVESYVGESQDDEVEIEPELESELSESVNEGREPPCEEPEYALEDMSEVASYGNSEESMAQDGVLSFTIFIEGIDSKELRSKLEGIFIDPKLNLDSAALLRSVSFGRLALRKVNSAKAAVIVKKLKPIEVKVRWEQSAITQA